MKQAAKAILAIFALFVSSSNSVNLRQNFVRNVLVDRTTDPNLEFAIRKNPTIVSEVKYSPFPPASQQGTQVMHFSNSNDNNGPDVRAPDFGRKAEIVNPAIYVHSKGTMSVVQETPAHVGWRDEKTVVTSLNKETNKVEQHQINHKSPIIGTIQEVINSF